MAAAFAMTLLALILAISWNLFSSRAGDFEAAYEQARSLSKVAPPVLKGLHETYLDRLAAFAAAPPEAWNGVYGLPRNSALRTPT